MGQFTATVFQMANELSIEYKDETRVMCEEPNISNILWKKSAIWAKDNKIPTIKVDENDSEFIFYAPSTKWLESGKEFDVEAVKEVMEMDWKSFDQYKQFGFSMFYTVCIAKDKETWKKYSKCDCPAFFAAYVCKHSVGIALRRKIAVLPRTTIPTLLSQNKKSGRPAKSVKALLIQ